jgi:hypothetical protein
MEWSAAPLGEPIAGRTPPPAPAPLIRPAGRHEAQRRPAPTLAFGAVPLAVIVVSALVINWLISSAGGVPRAADASPAGGDGQAATTGNAGPSSRPPGPGAFGNLVVNWSLSRT